MQPQWRWKRKSILPWTKHSPCCSEVVSGGQFTSCYITDWTHFDSIKRINWCAEPRSGARTVVNPRCFTFRMEANLSNLFEKACLSFSPSFFLWTAVGPVRNAAPHAQQSPVISSPAPVIKDTRCPLLLALQPEPSRRYPPSVFPSLSPTGSLTARCRWGPVGFFLRHLHPAWSAGDGRDEAAVRLLSGIARHGCVRSAGPGGRFGTRCRRSRWAGWVEQQGGAAESAVHRVISLHREDGVVVSRGSSPCWDESVKLVEWSTL